MTLDEQIAMAMRHVETGRENVNRQHHFVARGLPRSAELLDSFERTQEIFESDLAALIKRK